MLEIQSTHLGWAAIGCASFVMLVTGAEEVGPRTLEREDGGGRGGQRSCSNWKPFQKEGLNVCRRLAWRRLGKRENA